MLAMCKLLHIVLISSAYFSLSLSPGAERNSIRHLIQKCFVRFGDFVPISILIFWSWLRSDESTLMTLCFLIWEAACLSKTLLTIHKLHSLGGGVDKSFTHFWNILQTFWRTRGGGLKLWACEICDCLPPNLKEFDRGARINSVIRGN